MKMLDLFCSAGGAAMGYHRASDDCGFIFDEIVGVDINPQPHYPFEFIKADVMSLPIEWFKQFDLIHASPPCQGYIQRNKNLDTSHPKLINEVRAMLVASGVPYVIENVEGAPLRDPVRLCGTLFGLPLLRHRLFESSMRLEAPRCHHEGTVASGDYAAVYAFGGKGHRHGRGKRDASPAPGPAWDRAMGINWMTPRELTQAIPPAYTQFIGSQFITT